MKTRFSKIVCVFVAVMLLGSVLGGFRDAKAEGKVELPVTNEPITITSWVAMDSKISATLQSFSEMASYQELFKRTGITIDFIHPPLGQETQSFNLMVASGDYSDIFEYNFATYPGGADKAINDGIIIPLNDLVKEYAPNYSAFLDSHPEYARQVTTDSGNLYGFVEAYPDDENGNPNIGRIVWGFQLRQDWLDEVGKEVPTTIDEWYDVLKAFKEAHPDAVPFTARKSLDNYGLNTFICAYGINYGWYIADDGTIKYGPAQPEYKEYLETMAKWYAEGLIDPDFALNDGTSVDAKVLSDQAGSWIGLLMGGMGKYLQTKDGADPNFNIVGAKFPVSETSPDAYNFLLKSEAYIGTVITTKNEHPVETVKMLDYLFTDEGRILMTYGIEGLTYEMVDGVPTFTDEVLHNANGWSVDNAIAHYTRGSASSTLYENDPNCYYQRMLYQQQRDAVQEWAKASAARTLPPITPQDNESERFASLMTPIQTYVDEMFMKFVMGQKPLSEFDSYVKDIESMGLSEVQTIQQNAYDRYLQRAR